jgi:hypothetical protein
MNYKHRWMMLSSVVIMAQQPLVGQGPLIIEDS